MSSHADIATEIIPNMYVSGWEAGNNLPFILKNNIKLIINCAIECNVPSFIADGQHLQGICYLHCKLQDDSDANIEQYFKDTAINIKNTLSRGEGVLIHCMMGISRSATIAISYLMQYGLDINTPSRMSYDQAFDHIASKRKIGPNMGFILALSEMEENEMKTIK